MRNRKLSANPKFHPVVMDERGSLRKRFNTLNVKTHVSKKALAAKIFEIGLGVLENAQTLN